jgi:hypothetical protein
MKPPLTLEKLGKISNEVLGFSRPFGTKFVNPEFSHPLNPVPFKR